jgi:putative SOS response-associated peptidase YedK
MCGRYSLLDLSDFVNLFPWVVPPEQFAPRYNIAPSQPILALTNRDGGTVEHLIWGLIPIWAKPEQGIKPMINARAESVAEKPAFRGSLRHHRCIIPASGFYEWAPSPTGKQPQYITLPKKQPLLFAGLWAESHDGGGGEIRTGCIITTAANSFMQRIHDRMPAILAPDEAKRWIETPDQDALGLLELLRPYPGTLKAVPVSRAVNSPSSDTPSCIQSVEDEGLFT